MFHCSAIVMFGNNIGTIWVQAGSYYRVVRPTSPYRTNDSLVQWGCAPFISTEQWRNNGNNGVLRAVRVRFLVLQCGRLRCLLARVRVRFRLLSLSMEVRRAVSPRARARKVPTEALVSLTGEGECLLARVRVRFPERPTPNS